MGRRQESQAKRQLSGSRLERKWQLWAMRTNESETATLVEPRTHSELSTEILTVLERRIQPKTKDCPPPWKKVKPTLQNLKVNASNLPAYSHKTQYSSKDLVSLQCTNVSSIQLKITCKETKCDPKRISNQYKHTHVTAVKKCGGVKGSYYKYGQEQTSLFKNVIFKSQNEIQNLKKNLNYI